MKWQSVVGAVVLVAIAVTVARSVVVSHDGVGSLEHMPSIALIAASLLLAFRWSRSATRPA